MAVAPEQTVAGTQSTLSQWAGPYVTDMLGKGWALSETGYTPYTGQLAAGPSDLQNQAFSGLANLTVPDSLGQAAEGLGQAADAAGNMSYDPNTYGNFFGTPDAYMPGNYGNYFSNPGDYTAGQYESQFAAPENMYEYEGSFSNLFENPDNLYSAGDISTRRFDQDWADHYMNPYVEEIVNPQLREARRQAEISRMRDAGRLTQAGSYGGSRQAIMESELNRNLMQEQSDIVGEGYARAYDNAQDMFTSDEDRFLRAAVEQERARQAGSDAGLQAAELGARYGLSALENAEQAKQFASQQGIDVADLAARYGLSADELAEQSRQFGAGYGLDAASEAARYGLAGDELGQADRQFGATYGLDAAGEAARYGLAGAELSEDSQQFGAGYGLDALRQQIAAENARAGLGMSELASQMEILDALSQAGQTQRDIDQQGISADYAQFRQEQQYPYEQLAFQQSLLSGLPIASRDVNYNELSMLQEILGGGGAFADLINDILNETESSGGGGTADQGTLTTGGTL